MRCIECLHHCEIIFCLAKNAIYNKRDICQWHFQILKRDKKDETMGRRNCCHLILIIIFRHMSFKVLKICLPKPIFNSKNHLNFSETDFPLFFWQQYYLITLTITRQHHYTEHVLYQPYIGMALTRKWQIDKDGFCKIWG